MKILKFNEINFGSYKNFKWGNNLEEFKTINIFYGRNYSGKTTLSRIARSFELKKHNEDFLDGNFKIKLEDGSFLTQNDVINSNLDIRVYNSDFVKENLNYLYDKKGNIKGFKSIGVEQKDIKESIEKRKEILKTRNEKLKDIQANRENISKTQQAKIKTLNEKLIDKAKLVKSEPNLIKQGSNYDKRNLENDLIEIKDNINAYILNNEEQNQLIKILEDKEKQNIIFKNTFNKDNFQGIFTYSLKILEKEVIIKENLTSELRKWLEEGLEFHKEHSFTQQCKFCNNPLTLERIAWIENNIKDDSGEKEQIEKELKDLLDNFESYKLESKKLLLGIEYENFYSNYKDIFIGLKEQLGVSIANYNEELLKIEKKLTKKKKDVFTPMKLENINDFSDEILQILNKIENLCKENNEYAKNLLSKQDEARKKLRLNEVAKFAKDSDCFAKQDEIKNLGQKLSNMQSTIETEKNEINNYNLEIEKYKEKHMLKVARYVDEEMKKITSVNTKLSTSDAAILSAINITDVFFECCEENEELVKENEELNKKVGTGDEEIKLEMKKLELSLQGKIKAEEDLNTKIEELNKLIQEQKSKISDLENNIQSKEKEIENFKSQNDELKTLAENAEERAKIAEQLSSKFQNDAYRVQLEKIEIENELKYFKANR